jgi:hypothetical protein
MTAPTLRRDLSPLTSASLEAGNVVLRQYDPTTGQSFQDVVTLWPEERRALATFLAEVERLEVLAEAEVLCGVIRPEDDAYCAELVGHEDAGLDHLWVGGVHNLCMAEPIRLALPKPERKEDR